MRSSFLSYPNPDSQVTRILTEAHGNRHRASFAPEALHVPSDRMRLSATLYFIPSNSGRYPVDRSAQLTPFFPQAGSPLSVIMQLLDVRQAAYSDSSFVHKGKFRFSIPRQSSPTGVISKTVLCYTSYVV